MNKDLLRHWLVEDATQYAEEFADGRDERPLPELLSELANRKDVSVPDGLPTRAAAALKAVRRHFRDDVSSGSLVLHHHFPGEYLFYRVSALEPEIFEGLALFAEIVPAFNLGFAKVGPNGFERYLRLNEALLAFANEAWPSAANHQRLVAQFLYQGLGDLFSEPSGYRRYWLMVTRPEHFAHLDSEDTVGWSGSKEMQPGDIVFMYRTAPRKAVTDVHKVTDGPRFSPWEAWGGFSVDISRLCRLDDVPFGALRDDPIAGAWGMVRSSFQGAMCVPLPEAVYNRLLDFVPEKVRNEHDLVPELGWISPPSAWFGSEEEFETEVVVPLLRRWGFQYDRQHPRTLPHGSGTWSGRVDFLVRDQSGNVTLFENKSRVRGDPDLEEAAKQARYYALMLGLHSFVVASPEGVWVFRLDDRHEKELVEKALADSLPSKEASLKAALLRLRP